MNKNKILSAAIKHADSKADPDTIGHTHRALSFQAGAMWQAGQNAAEIAALLNLLSEVHNFSPAGSGGIPQWLETRVKVRQTLEKYGL